MLLSLELGEQAASLEVIVLEKAAADDNSNIELRDGLFVTLSI